MPVKWTKPKTQPKAEKPKGDNKPKADGTKGGKPKGKPANAKAAADKKEAK